MRSPRRRWRHPIHLCGRTGHDAPDTPAVDVHAHAVPMPMLRWLQERGLAELAGAAPSVIRLRPAGERYRGRRAAAAGPLAYEVPDRLAEMDAAGTSHHAVSLPPFLFCSTADDQAFVADDRVVRQRPARRPRGPGARPPRRPGSVPLGWPGAAEKARRCLDQLGMAGITIGSQAPAATWTIRSTRTCGRCSPSAGYSSFCTRAACRTPAGSGTSTWRSWSAIRWRRRSPSRG